MTQEEIKEKSEQEYCYEFMVDPDITEGKRDAYIEGATWANQQRQQEIDSLKEKVDNSYTREGLLGKGVLEVIKERDELKAELSKHQAELEIMRQDCISMSVKYHELQEEAKWIPIITLPEEKDGDEEGYYVNWFTDGHIYTGRWDAQYFINKSTHWRRIIKP
jgi:hypothetical protein